MLSSSPRQNCSVPQVIGVNMLCKVRGTVPLTSRQLALVLIYLPEQNHILHTQCSLLASYTVSFRQCRPDHGDPCLKSSGLHRATRIECKHFNLLRKGLVSACPWHLAYTRTLCTHLLQLLKLPAPPHLGVSIWRLSLCAHPPVNMWKLLLRPHSHLLGNIFPKPLCCLSPAACHAL